MNRRQVLWLGAGCLSGPALGDDRGAAAISAYERASGGHVGFYAEEMGLASSTRDANQKDRQSVVGHSLAWRADERFVMCSTFKASLAACVLARVDRGLDSLEERIRFGPADLRAGYAPVAREHLDEGEMSVGAMCEAAVEQSDNTCANLLLSRIGGPAALTDFWRRTAGDPITRLDDPEPVLNRTPPGGSSNTTTPRAMAQTLQRLVLGPVLAESSRAKLTDWLQGCKTGAYRLRAGLPADWRIGNKTGNNGGDAAGDIAVAWPQPGRAVVVSVYTRGGRPTPGQLDDLFSAVGRLVGDRFASAR